MDWSSRDHAVCGSFLGWGEGDLDWQCHFCLVVVVVDYMFFG